MYVPSRFAASFRTLKIGLVLTVGITTLWVLFFVNWSDWLSPGSGSVVQYADGQKTVTATTNVNVPPKISLNAPLESTPKALLPLSTIIFSTKTAKQNVTTAELTTTIGTTTVKPTTTGPLPLCPDPPPKLVGPLAVNFEQPSFEEIAAAHPLLKPGGRYRPPDCTPRNGPTAIIIPYRNREAQLRGFLHHMHPILQRQLLEYVIIVVEQAGTDRFNRAYLMNIGYKESLKLLDNNTQFQCYVFHDVDLLPEDDRGIYTCKDKSIHLSGYINTFDYKIPYGAIFGGASAIPRQHFEMINGYSNVFFGWGGEDDDVHDRLVHLKLPIMRYDKEQLRYKMFKHDHEKTNAANPNRWALLKKTVARMHTDGLNSLSYRLLQRDDLPTYTRVLVEFTEEEVYTAVFGSPELQL